MIRPQTVLPGQINTPVKSKEAQARQIRADVMDFVAAGGTIYYAKPNESGRPKIELNSIQKKKILDYSGN